MIRDRGRIKWNSLMLPEHVSMLRNWAKEDEHENRGQLDEQKLEWLNEIAREAIQFEKEVRITYFIDHHFEKLIGKLDSYEPSNREFRVIKEEKITKIPIEMIEDITIL